MRTERLEEGNERTGSEKGWGTGSSVQGVAEVASVEGLNYKTHPIINSLTKYPLFCEG